MSNENEPDLSSSRGRRWEEIANEAVSDKRYVIKTAIDIAAKFNAEHPDEPPISWKDLLDV